MNFFSLGFALGVQIYLKLEDQGSKNIFSLVCKDFRTLKHTGDSLYRIYRYIIDNYQLIKDSSSIKELSPTNFRTRVIFLSECHISAHHRKINSQLINMLWIEGLSELYLETYDESQVPQVCEIIKSQIKCWDIDDKNFIVPSWYLINALCCVGKSYVECFIDKEYKFKEFFEAYQESKILLYSLLENQIIADFYSTEIVESICTQADIEDRVDFKKKCLLELTHYLGKEATKVSEYFNETLISYNLRRNQTLVTRVVASILSNKSPIVVAGHAHTISDEVQALKKFKRIGTIALMPRNESKVELPSTSSEADVKSYLYESIGETSNFWHEITTILRFFNERHSSKANLVSYVLSNEHLFRALQQKIKSYKFGENMELWNAFPGYIYMSELLRLSK